MITRRTTSHRSKGAARALVVAVSASLALGLTGAPATSAAAPLVDLRPASGSLGGPLATADAATTLADVSAAAKRKKRRGFGKLRLGVSTGFDINYHTPSELKVDFNRAKSLGVKQVRVDIGWALVQPERNIIDWSRSDAVLAAAKRKKLKVLAVIGLTPEWAKLADGSPNPSLFGDFVDAAARRYKSKVANWELWNEPNQRHRWDSTPNPAQYARVVEAGSVAVRRRDPRAKILMGALAPAVDDPSGAEMSPETFLKGVYAAGIDRSAYDAVSIHPFSYPALPSGDESWNTFHRVPQIYRIVKNNGDRGKPLWFTEYGARTGNTSNSVTFKRHRKLMVEAYRETKKLPYVQALFFYSLRDASPNRGEPEDNFGLLKHSGKPKMAYRALKRELGKN